MNLTIEDAMGHRHWLCYITTRVDFIWALCARGNVNSQSQYITFGVFSGDSTVHVPNWVP